MDSINVNLDNLTKEERNLLMRLVEKSNKTIRLSDIEIGKTFRIGDVTYIKFGEENGVTTAITKDIVFNSRFGDNNNFAKSDVYNKLKNDFLPKLIEEIGIENICDITTDLTTLDGLTPYDNLTSKISLPTFDFYRANVHIFDKYKLDKWWWLATPESAKPHDEPNWIVCVSPPGFIGVDNYRNINIAAFVRFYALYLLSLYLMRINNE